MKPHIMFERNEHAPLEVASDPESFANTYAGLCGVIPIDDLVNLYVRTFPEQPKDYKTMRKGLMVFLSHQAQRLGAHGSLQGGTPIRAQARA